MVIPNSVPDDEESIIAYALPKIKEKMKSMSGKIYPALDYGVIADDVKWLSDSQIDSLKLRT